MASAVLLHSSRSKAVCAQASFVYGKISVPPLQESRVCWQNARSISTVSIILWLTLRGCQNSLFLIPSTKQLSMSIACCFANIHRIFVKMKQSFPISRCHSECIQFPTASCERGLSKTCGRQGAGLEKGWLPCLHEGADLFNPVKRS